MKTGNQIEEVFQAIQKNKQEFSRKVAAIRDNSNYTDAAKNNLADLELKKATQLHESLLDEYKQAIDNERGRLEREAFFGNDEQYHNAVSRISTLDDKQRQRALELAIKTGDKTTLRAIAAISHANEEPGWNTILKVAEHDRHVDALVQFEKAYGIFRNVNQKFAQKVYLSRPTKPNMTVQRKPETTTVQRDMGGRNIG